jgi:hypothetical protein
MCSLSYVFFLVILVGFSSEISGCHKVYENSVAVDKVCGSKDNPEKFIEINERKVKMGRHHMRIRLEEPSDESQIYCGENSYSFSWKENGKGNQVRVTYLSNIIRISVYFCKTFDGPSRLGIKCAVEAFSSGCPLSFGVNHTCVFEVKTNRFSSETVTSAEQVTTEVAVTVREKAQVKVGVTHSKEETIVNTYTVDSRSYIVIPAGYKFCSFSEVNSEDADDPAQSPTGYKWSCNLPTFVQTTKERCTDLTRCESESPCSIASSQPLGSGKKSAEAQPVAMLLALCIIVGCNLANCIG